VCTDVDECANGTDNCHANATCTNTPGSFLCTCLAGYAGDGVTCNDIDECAEGTHNCDPNATCTNTPGDFTCACNAGYTGNGVVCADIDECSTGTDNCHANAACTNTPGSFHCACNAGYRGDGVTCEDIDECAEGTHDCDPNATCANLPGSFDCSCNEGYEGDGRTCDLIDDCPDDPAKLEPGHCGCGVAEPALEILAARHTVGTGSHPGSIKTPLVGIEVCAYDMSAGSCARMTCGGISHSQYECIATTCPAAACAVTDAAGACTLAPPPGEYLVVSLDATKTVLPDPLGVSGGHVDCGHSVRKYLQQIIRADGTAVPAKTTRRTGSELLIIEPEFIVWDDPEQLYPFLFESVGDWDITTAVAPPEGFVADYDRLAVSVDYSLKAVQFTIIEVGSDLVPTRTTFEVTHNGQREVIRSSVGIQLTEEYARSRGFDVRELESRGLILNKMMNRAPSRRR
jgi:hypothetical protein